MVNHQIRNPLRCVGMQALVQETEEGPVHLLSLTRFWYRCNGEEQSQERGLSCFSLPKERVSQLSGRALGSMNKVPTLPLW